MFDWLRKTLAELIDDDDVAWDLEPHLSDTVSALLKIARDHGDCFDTDRVFRHILTFRNFDMASAFRDTVPDSWTTRVTKRSDYDVWQCECDRTRKPSLEELTSDTSHIWLLGLAIYPSLWSYVGMYDSTGDYLWYVACQCWDVPDESG